MRWFLTQTTFKMWSVAVLLLRIIVGLILFVVGAGKVFGWFGGAGIEATIQFYLNLGVSLPLAYLSMFTEFIGGLLFLLGLITRPIAVLIIVNLFVAAVLSLPSGLFLAIFPFSLMISTIAVLLTGPMKYSIDQLIQPINYSLKEERKTIE